MGDTGKGCLFFILFNKIFIILIKILVVLGVKKYNKNKNIYKDRGGGYESMGGIVEKNYYFDVRAGVVWDARHCDCHTHDAAV